MYSVNTEGLLEDVSYEYVPDYVETYRAWQPQEPQNRGPFRLVLQEAENFTLTELAAMPATAPDWIFQDLWAAGTIGLFTGDGGVGKTHQTLQLLRAIAEGSQIQNTPFVCPKARPVVYITQEDEAEFIKQEFLVQDPTLTNRKSLTDNIRIISTARSGKNFFLRDTSQRNDLISKISEKGSVFVLDSWSTFIQCNENDNTELIKEIRALREIMKATDSTPLLIHHRPKTNMQTFFQSSFRGGTALPANCRFHIMLSKSTTNGNQGGVRLSFEKVSRAAQPGDIEMTFDQQRRLFVASGPDKFIGCFTVGQQLTTTQVIQALGLNPAEPKDRKEVLNALGHRVKTGALKRIQPGSKSHDAVWERVI